MKKCKKPEQVNVKRLILKLIREFTGKSYIRTNQSLKALKLSDRLAELFNFIKTQDPCPYLCLETCLGMNGSISVGAEFIGRRQDIKTVADIIDGAIGVIAKVKKVKSN